MKTQIKLPNALSRSVWLLKASLILKGESKQEVREIRQVKFSQAGQGSKSTALEDLAQRIKLAKTLLSKFDCL